MRNLSGYGVENHRRYCEDFVCPHWNSEESELVPKQNLERDLKRHGRDSNFYRIRRLGLPPA
jgi:hypothetical protein